jgi:hypothetical protein
MKHLMYPAWAAHPRRNPLSLPDWLAESKTAIDSVSSFLPVLNVFLAVYPCVPTACLGNNPEMRYCSGTPTMRFIGGDRH